MNAPSINSTDLPAAYSQCPEPKLVIELNDALHMVRSHRGAKPFYWVCWGENPTRNGTNCPVCRTPSPDPVTEV